MALLLVPDRTLRSLVSISIFAAVAFTGSAARAAISERVITLDRAASYEFNDGLSQAIARFGEPDTRKVRADHTCRARWDEIGLSIDYPACHGDFSALRADATGESWRTRRGLRIGDAASRVGTLYPNATRSKLSDTLTRWNLRTATPPSGIVVVTDEDSVVRLSARTGASFSLPRLARRSTHAALDATQTLASEKGACGGIGGQGIGRRHRRGG